MVSGFFIIIDRVIDYDYDDLFRLTSENVTDAINGNYEATYTYDDVGNHKTSTVDGVTTSFDYDFNERLLTAGSVTYDYDDQGNQLSITDGANVTKQSYNDLNQLVSSQVNSEPEIRFSYDAKGIRVSRTHNGITTQYLVDHNRDYAQVLAETNNGQLDTSYIYGHDLIKQERAGNNSFYLTDGIGSTRLLADAAGTVTDTYHYAAFGELLSQTGSTENSYRYTGEQYDEGLDNYYLRARYYNQNVGRLTQQDTYLGRNFEPITLHKYLYANIDPISYADPSSNVAMFTMFTNLSHRAGALAVTYPRVASVLEIGASIATPLELAAMTPITAGLFTGGALAVTTYKHLNAAEKLAKSSFWLTKFKAGYEFESFIGRLIGQNANRAYHVIDGAKEGGAMLMVPLSEVSFIEVVYLKLN